MPAPNPILVPSPDGENVVVIVNCGPMVDALSLPVPLSQVERVVAQCRARQLGADPFGEL